MDADTSRDRLPAVAVDLDGTLAEYDYWRGIEHIGKPRPGATSFLRVLWHTHRIILHTARLNGSRPLEERVKAQGYIVAWLNEHDIYVDEIWTNVGKPWAVAYLDDRAVAIQTNPTESDFNTAMATIREGVHQ